MNDEMKKRNVTGISVSKRGNGYYKGRVEKKRN
jgi:hypothetical protein